MQDSARKPTRPPSEQPSATARRPARAELIWDGKYDAQGKRVAPLRVALPFQTVETVNESAQDRQKGFQFGAGFREEAWRNRLIWGDKKYVLPSLLPEFAGKVNLIYIDPPFDTGADFSFTATVPDEPESDEEAAFTFTKEPSIIEQKAYRDTWGRGLESYLQWFYEAAVVLHELLHENGSLYVHLDWHVAHHAKLVLDEVFGIENFRNEIIWKRTTARSGTQGFNHIHDTILFYSKADRFTWHVQYTPYSKEYLETMFRNQDASGKRYRESPLTAPGLRSGSSGKSWEGCDPSKIGNGRHWAIPSWIKPNLSQKAQTDSLVALGELEAMGRIVWSREGEGRPNFKQYADDLEGVELQSIWTDFGALSGSSPESMNYPTQKPEALLDRILRSSSNEHDLILDSFSGSGTTAAVAEKLGRRWIACDLGRFSIHTIRKRLLSISDVRPFNVQNLGKYERQAWAGAQFGDNQAAERQRAYIEFILKLAQATPLNGYTWLHGVKAGRMIHVGAVDAPVSVGDVTQIAAEFKRAIGTGKDAPKTNGVDVLGWDFAFELNEVAKQQAAAANIQMRFLRIPRDVMDKRAVEQGDIHFFELAALSVEVKANKRNVFLKLKDFVIPPDDVPEDARKAVKHWSQWIDYWAVDWDNRSDTFHNEWQTYRTRKDKSLQLEITHAYADPGESW
jgi:DNA modification methylase